MARPVARPTTLWVLVEANGARSSALLEAGIMFP